MSNELIDIIKNGDYEEKIKALDKIKESDDYELISDLIDLLEGIKNRVLKERILIVLNYMIPKSDFRCVEKMFRSPDPFVRNGVVEIIKRSNIPLIKFLKHLSDDDDRDVRKFVIDALSREKSEEVLQILRRRLNDTDINIVYTAIEYLGNFKDEKSVEQIESILMSSDSMMVICSALEALSKINKTTKKDVILDRFKKDSNPMIIFSILKFLSTFGTKDDLDYIEYILENHGLIYLKEIVDCIEGIIIKNNLNSIPESIKIKLELICEKSDNPVNKYEIMKLIARTDKTNSLQIARKMLDDENDMIKLGGIEILADIGDDSDIERLEQLAEDTESDELLEAIGDAVMKIDERINS